MSSTAISSEMLSKREALMQDANVLRTALERKDHDYDHSQKLSTLRLAAGSFRRHLERLLFLERKEEYLRLFPDSQPSLRSQAGQLDQEHMQICQALNQLIRRLNDLSPTDHVGYGYISDELASLLERVDRHCNQETELLEKALL